MKTLKSAYKHPSLHLLKEIEGYYSIGKCNIPYPLFHVPYKYSSIL